jgi:DNA polymerase-2
MTAIAGWLFDAYPQGDKMVFWIKREDGRTIRLEENWSHSIYVAADNKEELMPLTKDDDAAIKEYEFAKKYEKITDNCKSEVLKLTLSDSAQRETLAKRIMLSGRFGQFRLYNVDLLPAQAYFYEHDLFPLAFCKVAASKDELFSLQDDVWSLDYTLPKLKTIHLRVKPEKQERRLPKFTDEIESISIKHEDDDIIKIDSSDEVQTLSTLAYEIAKIDPDFVFTQDGDAFVFPYLAHRANVNGSSSILVLGREPHMQTRKPSKDGTTYFSYGRIHNRPSSTQLFGRVHIDTHNSFILDAAGMQGLYEVARICRMPLHKASRASIGRCMSSLQCYHATLQDILIPWKPNFAEHFKTYSQLFIADRGGMIFDPRIGVHEQVGEFDFASLYPSIMSKKNLSGETVLCACCLDSRLRVPELGWHICEKKIGIVPQSLEILLKKRAQYKQWLKSSQTDAITKQIYDSRQNSLKWILVTSFGYLGYSNSKFGNIDAHIATCAFDRQVLLESVRVAEYYGFRVLHGIVDSVWLYRRGATRADYSKLKEAIEHATGFAISFEGIYKWIAFVHSKGNDQVPVQNRYFGVFEDDDGSLKIRGIEARRHDTPPFFAKCQQEILKTMAMGSTVQEVKALMPQVESIFNRYVQLLKEGKALLEDLVFTKQTSKDSGDHVLNTGESSALRQLEKEGKSLRAGEVLQYIITDYYNKRSSKRTTPVELIDDNTSYDVKRYTELLAASCNSITEPFGHIR